MAFKSVAMVSAGDSGSGADAAWHLSAAGHEVAILSSSKAGEALAHELGGLGVAECRRSAASVQRLVDGAMDRWGRVDVLVNSVEYRPAGSSANAGNRHLHAIMDAYLMNIVRPTRIVAPIMAEAGGGTIVNIVNVVNGDGVDPLELAPALEIFRGAMMNFCTLVENRFGASGVSMAVVIPDRLAGQSEQDERGGGMPIWRFRKPEEIPGLITCLVADTPGLFDDNQRFDGPLTSQYKAAA
ncbi:MAG: SDR family NAD(P)-dependent oxidoreductase [Pseudomonadota bacterium]